MRTGETAKTPIALSLLYVIAITNRRYYYISVIIAPRSDITMRTIITDFFQNVAQRRERATTGATTTPNSKITNIIGRKREHRSRVNQRRSTWRKREPHHRPHLLGKCLSSS